MTWSLVKAQVSQGSEEESLSCKPREAPAAANLTAEAGTQCHLVQGALLTETLANVQGKHIPPWCPDSSRLGRNPTATKELGQHGWRTEKRVGTQHLSTPNISFPIMVAQAV